MNPPNSVEVVVIGGGIVGCSTAYYLARSGVSVVLCEKGEIAAEQSSRNWGFVRKQGRHPAELPLMIESDRLWGGLERELDRDLGFFRGGTLYFSDTEKSHQSNLSWLEHARAFDLDTRFLSKQELSRLMPELENNTQGALYTASDARAEPDKATAAIARSAIALGAVVLNQCAVRGLDMEAGRVAGVVTEHGRIRASSVVCAGGAWSSYFCRNLGLVFPQLKVIASVMCTEPAPAVGEHSIWSNGLGMRRRQDGGYNIACGGSFDCDLAPDHLRFFRRYLDAYKHGKENVSLRFGTGFFRELMWPSKWPLDQVTPFEKHRVLDPPPNPKLLDQAYRQLGIVFPVLAGTAEKKRWAGMIDVTPDELPLICGVDRIPGFFLSTGYSGHGFGIGPGAGKVTAELVSGKSTCVDLSPFTLARLVPGH